MPARTRINVQHRHQSFAGCGWHWRFARQIQTGCPGSRCSCSKSVLQTSGVISSSLLSFTVNGDRQRIALTRQYNDVCHIQHISLLKSESKVQDKLVLKGTKRES